MMTAGNRPGAEGRLASAKGAFAKFIEPQVGFIQGNGHYQKKLAKAKGAKMRNGEERVTYGGKTSAVLDFLKDLESITDDLTNERISLSESVEDYQKAVEKLKKNQGRTVFFASGIGTREDKEALKATVDYVEDHKPEILALEEEAKKEREQFKAEEPLGALKKQEEEKNRQNQNSQRTSSTQQTLQPGAQNNDDASHVESDVPLFNVPPKNPGQKSQLQQVIDIVSSESCKVSKSEEKFGDSDQVIYTFDQGTGTKLEQFSCDILKMAGEKVGDDTNIRNNKEVAIALEQIAAIKKNPQLGQQKAKQPIPSTKVVDSKNKRDQDTSSEFEMSGEVNNLELESKELRPNLSLADESDKFKNSGSSKKDDDDSHTTDSEISEGEVRSKLQPILSKLSELDDNAEIPDDLLNQIKKLEQGEVGWLAGELEKKGNRNLAAKLGSPVPDEIDSDSFEKSSEIDAAEQKALKQGAVDILKESVVTGKGKNCKFDEKKDKSFVTIVKDLSETQRDALAKMVEDGVDGVQGDKDKAQAVRNVKLSGKQQVVIPSPQKTVAPSGNAQNDPTKIGSNKGGGAASSKASIVPPPEDSNKNSGKPEAKESSDKEQPTNKDDKKESSSSSGSGSAASSSKSSEDVFKEMFGDNVKITDPNLLANVGTINKLCTEECAAKLEKSGLWGGHHFKESTSLLESVGGLGKDIITKISKFISTNADAISKHKDGKPSKSNLKNVSSALDNLVKNGLPKGEPAADPKGKPVKPEVPPPPPAPPKGWNKPASVPETAEGKPTTIEEAAKRFAKDHKKDDTSSKSSGGESSTATTTQNKKAEKPKASTPAAGVKPTKERGGATKEQPKKEEPNIDEKSQKAQARLKAVSKTVNEVRHVNLPLTAKSSSQDFINAIYNDEFKSGEFGKDLGDALSKTVAAKLSAVILGLGSEEKEKFPNLEAKKAKVWAIKDAVSAKTAPPPKETQKLDKKNPPPKKSNK